MERPMQKLNDLSRSRAVLEPDVTLIAVIEMSLSSWLVAGIVPGVERQPLKKLTGDENALLKLLHRWQEEAEKAGRRIERIVVAFEAGRDGFWLARWLKAHNIEAYVIHPASIAVSREHRRARPIVSTPSCSNVLFSAGCAASVITARWSRSRQSRRRMPSGLTANVTA
jgi:transposase